MNKELIKEILELVFSAIWLVILVVGMFLLFTGGAS